MPELPHPLRPGQVPQSHDAEVAQLHVWRQVVAGQHGSGLGHEHLSTMGARPQAGTPDDRSSRVVAFVPQLRVARVQRHPHRQPWQLRLQAPLRLDRSPNPVPGTGERPHHAVALALLHPPHTARPTIASPRMSPWRDIAAAMSAGRSAHNRVDPSTSGNNRVTVPAGNANSTIPTLPGSNTNGRARLAATAPCPAA